MKKPVIALTTRPKNKEGKYELSAQYTNAVKRAGGIPLLVPPSGKFEEELFEIVDGIILTGGGDIDPVFYGGESHAKIYGLDEERDEFEIPLAREIVKRKIPALPICRGIQVLNVALGGTLHQHITGVEGFQAHGIPNGGGGTTNTFTFTDGSLVADVMGSPSTSGRCHHHQAVDVVAPGLVVTGTTDDGGVEVLELDEPTSWMVAVQWHPEETAATHAPSQALFDGLVAASRPQE